MKYFCSDATETHSTCGPLCAHCRIRVSKRPVTPLTCEVAIGAKPIFAPPGEAGALKTICARLIITGKIKDVAKSRRTRLQQIRTGE